MNEFWARKGIDTVRLKLMACGGCLVGHLKTPRQKTTNNDMAMSLSEADAVLAKFGYVEQPAAIAA